MDLISETKTDSLRIRLILLWALVEISLGGFLHMFRIPLTGISVGSIAILTVFLIARASETYKEVLQAFITVAGLKLFFSPQASPFSYLAMFVQTLCMLPLIGHYRNPGKWLITSLILLASLYSPLQKMLILWLTLGNELLVGMVEWLHGIHPISHLSEGIWWVPITAWIMIHLIAGVIISVFAIRWKTGFNIDNHLSEKWTLFNQQEQSRPLTMRNPRRTNVLVVLFFLVTIPVLILPLLNHDSWVLMIIRPLVLFGIWFIVIRPIIRFWGMHRRLSTNESMMHQQIQSIIPIFRRGVLFSWVEAKQVSWFRLPARFITVFFMWGLYLTWES
jgi:hypothetical protein